MTEIYINTELIELYSDEIIVMSYAVNNLFEIENRQGSYSNTFKIPATKKNNLILGFSNNVLSISDLPYTKIPCLIYTDGLLEVEGIAQIITASRSEYEIRILSGNSNWFELIADKSIQSALFGCAFSQYWNVLTVSASRANIWTDVFIYPNIDYGELFFLPAGPYDITFDKLYPAVYAKYLFKKIFEDAGLSIESDWFENDPLFEKQIIPFSSDWKRDRDYSTRNRCNYTLGTDVIQNAAGFIPINVHTNVGHVLDSPCFNFRLGDTITIPSTPFFLNPIRQIAETFCTLDGAIVTVNFNINYETDTLATCAGTTTQIICDYVDINGNTQLFNFFPVVSGCQAFTNVTGSITLNDVGRGGLRISMQQCKIYAGSTFDFIIEPSGLDEGDLDINTAFNFLTLGGILPDISRTDFILSIANQYGLIFEQTPLTNNVKIFQFGKIIGNIPNAIDWSKKLDLSDDPTISFLSDNYSRNNYFQYAEDSEDAYLLRQPNYGRGNFIVNADANNTEQIIFQSVFSAVIRLLSFSGSLELAYIPSNEGTAFTIVNGRFAYVNFDASTAITINGQPLLIPQPNVYFEELIFQNLLDKNYPLLTQTINSNKAVTCLIRLNNLDVNQLDFSRPIWIDYFGAYFYLNEISQYKVNEKDSTQITLIIIQN